ncbi:hypothetical protein GCM10010493_39360 [Streptomyces lavendulae subsp. grasserius]
MVQCVRLRVGEDLGYLVEGEAQFAVEEDLLEPREVGVVVAAVPGPAAVAGREESRPVVVVQRAYGDPGEGRDLTDGVAHGPALSLAHSLKPDVGEGSTAGMGKGPAPVGRQETSA